MSRKILFLIMLFVVSIGFLAVISKSAHAAENSGYQIDKSSSGGGRVDRIDITSFALNFGATAGTITLDGIVTTFNDWSTNKIGWVVVPTQVEGIADVVVTTAEGTQLNIGTFKVNPKITSLSPSPIYVTKTETELTINGEGFGNEGNFVTGGGGTMSVVSWSDTKIVVKVSKNKPLGIGQQQIIVNNSSSPFPLLVKQAVCDTEVDWACTGWGACSENGLREQICTQVYECDSIGIKPETSKVCKPTPKIISISPQNIYSGTVVTILGNHFGNDCTKSDFYCGVKVNNELYKISSSDWSDTSIKFTVPFNVESGYLQIVDTKGQQSIQFNFTVAPPCYSDTWSCGNWTTCSADGSQTRVCNKTNDCSTADTPSPTTVQNCTPPQPTCTADTWSCENWGSCSPQGIQTRNCSKTFDCSSAETASPATSQYCESTKQNYQTPSADSTTVANQDTIIKATVKLVCPVSSTMVSQGSGTIISSSGLILTNKHVIDGTPGCMVGFIDDYDDEPYFGEKQIADIYKVSGSIDAAILKLRNPSNKILNSIDTSESNVANVKLGDKVVAYGYPAKFGTKVKYTSGDFSGTEGPFIETTAVIDSGNSGGGAYLKNGMFLGIPTAVQQGKYNNMGLVLSIKNIKNWMNGSSFSYNFSSSNNYSRVSSLVENLDLSNLDSLGLFVADNSSTEQVVDQKLQNKLKGRILLQVESVGEAWYVNPKDSKKYYMKDGAAAYTLMRYFSLGITNQNLDKIPKVADTTEMKNSTSACSKNALANQLKGKILLQVEEHGEAWYVEPTKCRAIYLKDGGVAYEIMRFLGLGITNNDLSKIAEGAL